eukprot:349849-Chlamydomonas_euryale.AAC.1
MVNFMLLGPSGGAQFHSVKTAAGVTKDADFIYSAHADIIEELEPKDKHRILGLVMDSASENVSAMKRLEEKYPWLITFGCQAHALTR